MTIDGIPPALRARSESLDTDLGTPTHPGRKIRLARERARLSLEELAALTKLARGTLEALEGDDFETLHEPVYVRGYYRKCAKVLGLSESDLIAGYEKLVSPKAPQAPTRLLGSNQTMASTLSRRRPASGRWLWVLAVFVLLGAGAFLLSQDPATLALVSRTGPVPTTLSNLDTALPEPVSTSAQPADAPPTTGSLSADATPATESTALSTDPAAPLVTSAQDGPLVLQFNSSSWVLIEDADGRVLLSGLRETGVREGLSGRPPYSLLIGYAPGVSVEYEGKPVNLGPYIKPSHTARISVP